jgi:type IV pilus assembly protein PilW
MNSNSHSMKSPSRRPDWQRDDGFGLVELMISIAIGLVILAALVTLFVNTSRNNREMATASSVIENGRFAIELLENDVVHAGYWSTYVPDFDDPTLPDDTSIAGDAVPTSTPLDIPDPCVAFAAASWTEGSDIVNQLLGIPVQVIDQNWCAAVLQNRVPGTDALVIRHAERCAPGEGSCADDVAGTPDLYLQASLCIGEMATTPYVFGTNGTEAFPLRRRNCVDPSEKRRYQAFIYYVRDFAQDEDDGIPTLVRSEFRLGAGGLAFQEPVPLVEGIDGLWVELGVDDVSITGGAVDNSAEVVWADPATRRRATNRGDSVPDEFVRCAAGAACSLGQLTNVTAVQIYVLARSREPTPGYTDTKTYAVGLAGDAGPYDDAFKRHVYSTSVRLHNVAGRRIRAGAEEVFEEEEEAGGGDEAGDPQVTP